LITLYNSYSETFFHGKKQNLKFFFQISHDILYTIFHFAKGNILATESYIYIYTLLGFMMI
jgi:hypothetical protein